ncbi:MAG: DnaJ domain-containing protein, partial [Planctomycetes bacterium]|nr:DnaJ domain-containing protein [Planctomycetota bacterium]
SADEIRKAHKKLSKKYHPDLNKEKDAAENFKQVQEAFDVLGNDEKRQQYDRFGHAMPGGGQGAPFNWGGGRPGAGGAGPVDFSDLFSGGGGSPIDLEQIFGGAFGGGGAGGRRQTRRGPKKGEDVEVEVDIPFQIAVEGGKYELHLDRGGKHESLTVTIPAGVDTGSLVRLAGQGHPGGNGGPAGDLKVRIRVTPHRYFRREGSHLLVDVPVTISEAALGAKVDAPTLSEGVVMVTIPPGTSSGAKLRLKGKGVLDRSTKERGDLFVVVKIVVPKKLSDTARALLEEFATAEPYTPRGGLW